MNFRISFSFSKTEQELKLRFWKWEIWRLNADLLINEKIASELKAKVEEVKEAEDTSFLQAFFYPNVESKIWRVVKKTIVRLWNLFTVNFENLEVKGSLGDPFYDSVAMGMAGGCYCPTWEYDSEDWSAKGTLILKASFFRFLFFIIGLIYDFLTLFFVLWRGVRLAKKYPNGENLEGIRKWIFLKLRS
ncbi:MAG: hypothetical protein LBU89_12880 [Fibromonadaceae bacterium]|jgi:hypothetical protein|nr:hypothetical protein [Fibromonadaceae bacterium]